MLVAWNASLEALAILFQTLTFFTVAALGVSLLTVVTGSVGSRVALLGLMLNDVWWRLAKIG